MELVV